MSKRGERTISGSVVGTDTPICTTLDCTFTNRQRLLMSQTLNFLRSTHSMSTRQCSKHSTSGLSRCGECRPQRYPGGLFSIFRTTKLLTNKIDAVHSLLVKNSLPNVWPKKQPATAAQASGEARFFILKSDFGTNRPANSANSRVRLMSATLFSW